MLSPTHLPVLPLLTTAIGLGGFTVGLSRFLNPDAAAWIYGCSPSASSHKLSRNNELRYLHALSVRNFATGATVLYITAYWRFGLSDGGVSASTLEETRLAVQRVLGVVALLGSMVPICDAAICWGWFDGDGNGNGRFGGVVAEKEKGTEKDKEGVMMGPKNAGGKVEVNVEAEMNGEDNAKWAAMVHATRSVFWLIGGLWCLLG